MRSRWRGARCRRSRKRRFSLGSGATPTASLSGDIYVAQEPYWFLYEKGPVAAMHGAPWSYDTYVPIIFAGNGIEARTIHRLVHPADVAPTLSSYLGLKPPSSAEGTPLEEILR